MLNGNVPYKDKLQAGIRFMPFIVVDPIVLKVTDEI